MTYNGAKKGLLRTLVVIAGYIVAFAAAGLFCGTAAHSVYDGLIKERIISGIEKSISDVDVMKNISGYLSESGLDIDDESLKKIISDSTADTLNENITGYIKSVKPGINVSDEYVGSIIDKLSLGSMLKRNIGDMPEYVKDAADGLTELDNSEVLNLLQRLISSERSASEYIEETLIRDNVVSVLRLIMYALIFAIVMLITGILASVFEKANKIPVAGKINMFLGGVAGFAQALAVLLAICVAIEIIIIFTSNGLVVINHETIENTHFLRYIFNIADIIF